MTPAQNQPGAADSERLISAANQLVHDARPGDAVRLLIGVIRADPRDGLARFHLACAMQAAGKPVEAAAMFRKAVEHLPGHPEPLVRLGKALERTRRPAEAIDALNQAIALNASDTKTNLLLESLAKRLAHLEAARERLKGTTGEQMPAKIRGAALLELGATLDALGEHREAFRAYSQGHQTFALTREAMMHHAGEYPARLRRAAEEVTPDVVASFRRDDAPRERPGPTLLVRLLPMVRDRVVEALRVTPGLVVSAKTSCMGQTARALEEMVPEAAGSPAAIAGLSRSEVASLRQRYWTLAEKAVGSGRLSTHPLIDAAPMNIQHIPLFRALFPDGRIILSVRDPRDMTLNCFFQRYLFNTMTVNLLHIGSVASCLADAAAYWERITAAAELPTHVIRSEDLDWAPRQTLSNLMGFLGQAYHGELDKLIRHRAAELSPEPPKTPRDFAPLEPLPGRWQFYRAELEPHLEKLAPALAMFNYSSKERAE